MRVIQPPTPFLVKATMSLDKFSQANSILRNISREISVLQERIANEPLILIIADISSCNTGYTITIGTIRIHRLRSQVSSIDSE